MGCIDFSLSRERIRSRFRIAWSMLLWGIHICLRKFIIIIYIKIIDWHNNDKVMFDRNINELYLYKCVCVCSDHF